MRKAIVTGATGFIGRHLIKELLNNDTKVFAVDRAESNTDLLPVSENVAFIECELSEIMRLSCLITEKDIDIIYHLAWEGVQPDSRDAFSKQTANIEYSLNCIRSAKEIGVKRIVLLGSTMEYLYNSKPIDESAIPTPQNAYGSAKLATRYLCAQLAKDLNLDLIYCAATSVYGVGREDNNVIYYTIKKLLSGVKPSVTKLEQKWDYIHIKDLAAALCAIGQCEKTRSFYALGNGDNLPLSHFIYMIRDLIDKNLLLGIGEVPYNSDKLPSSCIDTSALREDTGFEARTEFKDGIAEMIEYYRGEIK